MVVVSRHMVLDAASGEVYVVVIRRCPASGLTLKQAYQINPLGA